MAHNVQTGQPPAKGDEVAKAVPAAAEIEAVEKVLAMGDLSQLTPEQRVLHLRRICESLGLNPLTQPFAYHLLDDRLVLYARKDAAEQLRRIHGISLEITSREILKEAGVYVVTVRARTRDGRVDESAGVVSLSTYNKWEKRVVKLTGVHFANAIMKAETKAKRRATLSICGLGFMDETEVEDAGLAADETAAALPPPGGEGEPARSRARNLDQFEEEGGLGATDASTAEEAATSSAEGAGHGTATAEEEPGPVSAPPPESSATGSSGESPPSDESPPAAEGESVGAGPDLPPENPTGENGSEPAGDPFAPPAHVVEALGQRKLAPFINWARQVVPLIPAERVSEWISKFAEPYNALDALAQKGGKGSQIAGQILDVIGERVAENEAASRDRAPGAAAAKDRDEAQANKEAEFRGERPAQGASQGTLGEEY